MPQLQRLGYDRYGPIKLVAFIGEAGVVVRRPGGAASVMSVRDWEKLPAEPVKKEEPKTVSTQEEKDCLAAVTAMAVERADRLVHRESTDFVGRMNEALCEAEGALEEAGEADPLPLEQATEYAENLTELAALALAQLAIVAMQKAGK